MIPVRTVLPSLIAVLGVSMALGAVAQDSVTVEDAKDYLGNWRLDGEFAGNPMVVNLDLFDNRGKVNGLLSMAVAPQAQPIEQVEKTENGLLLIYELDFGPQQATIDMNVQVVGDNMTGRLEDRNGMFKLDFEGARTEKAFPAQLASKLDSAPFEDILGDWRLEVDMQGRKIPVTLHLADANGKLGAILSTVFTPQPQLVQQIERIGDGMLMSFEASMGPRSMVLNIQVERDGDGLAGSFADSSGFMSAEFTGGRAEYEKNLLERAHFASANQEATEDREERLAQAGPRDIRTRIGDATIRLRYMGVETDSPDYDRVAFLEDGVISFTDGRVTKLLIDKDLVFGTTVIKTHNLAEDYPGVYGVWVKKEDGEWKLVFNEQADVWGTQYDPSKDVAEVPLQYATNTEPVEIFNIGVSKQKDGSGVFVVNWGEHQWTAPFTVQ